jgi:hypothetical protein
VVVAVASPGLHCLQRGAIVKSVAGRSCTRVKIACVDGFVGSTGLEFFSCARNNIATRPGPAAASTRAVLTVSTVYNAVGSSNGGTGRDVNGGGGSGGDDEGNWAAGGGGDDGNCNWVELTLEEAATGDRGIAGRRGTPPLLLKAGFRSARVSSPL